MKNLKIFTKLFLSHIAVGLIAVVSLAVTFYVLLSDNLIQRTLNQLSSINILKEEAVAHYFQRSQQNLKALALEHKFLNIYTAVSTAVENGTSIHNSDMEDVENVCRLYNFKNLHLFDLDHYQLYSTDSTLYKDKVLQKIDSVIYAEPNRLMLIDASHISSDDQTLLFYYLPILRDSQRVGIVLVEENFENIQSILSETTGMGTTGESYIVGPGFTMRSASRFWPEKAPGEISVKTEAVINSFEGSPGTGIILDYRGEKVLSVYRPIRNKDLNWAIISEIDWTEAMDPIIHLRYYLIGITFFILLLTTLITLFLSNAIAQPILKLRRIILQLSRGIIPTQRILVDSSDEVGQMAEAIYQLTDGLKRTSTFAREIGSGNFNSPFVTLSEFDTLGQSLIQMRDALKRLNERETKMARARASALLEGQENERRRIIKELHDGVGQLLTAIRMRIEMLEGDDTLKEEIKNQINETIAEVRRISYNVMPQALVDFGLEAALRGLCDSMKRYSNLVVDFTYVKESDHALNFDVSTALFRIAQEGLNNIVKYAKASAVNLHIIDKEDEIYFVLEDNGIGFDENKLLSGSGMGLQNIKQRAELLNGVAEIHSTPGEGTVIEVHIPIGKK
jgi:signal transduction histidine kinase